MYQYTTLIRFYCNYYLRDPTWKNQIALKPKFPQDIYNSIPKPSDINTSILFINNPCNGVRPLPWHDKLVPLDLSEIWLEQQRHFLVANNTWAHRIKWYQTAVPVDLDLRHIEMILILDEISQYFKVDKADVEPQWYLYHAHRWSKVYEQILHGSLLYGLILSPGRVYYPKGFPKLDNNDETCTVPRNSCSTFRAVSTRRLSKMKHRITLKHRGHAMNMLQSGNNNAHTHTHTLMTHPTICQT